VRTYIGCFGSGLGHASRMLEVAGELLARNVEIEFSSSGEVASLIRRSGYRCNLLPLADVRYSESGEFSFKDTMASTPTLLGRTYQQVAEEISNMIRFDPDVVLSDSALPTVLAARALRIPVFTVLNQLNLGSPEDHPGAVSRLISFGTSTGMGRLWELSDQILLPDLPPPYTISERNLWGSNVEKTRYVGFLSSSRVGTPDRAALEFSADPRPKVFWQVSGPPMTRPPLLKLALRCAEIMSDAYSFVVSAGSPTSSTAASRVPGGWLYGWCDIANHYFRACDLVVSRAGHGTIGQAIISSKPSLLVPIPNQPEQEGNAIKAVRLGVSISVPQNEATVDRVRGSIQGLLQGGYGARSRALGGWASRFDAKKEIVSLLTEAASEARPVRR
jgi:UDP-N-acetylglucosamine--N-acetylmuramyl-(pentapeptide) pyrophosphoryl-undecaprenol N-acetylglucosamine transferase